MYDDMITDRACLDGLVYTRWLYENDKVSGDTFLFAEEVFDKVYPQYDKVFWLRPEFALVEDGTRSNDLNFRNEIDSLFEHYVNNKNLDVIKLSGSVRERVNSALEELR
jgi:nicotinamide riboside kinase